MQHTTQTAAAAVICTALAMSWRVCTLLSVRSVQWWCNKNTNTNDAKITKKYLPAPAVEDCRCCCCCARWNMIHLVSYHIISSHLYASYIIMEQLMNRRVSMSRAFAAHITTTTNLLLLLLPSNNVWRFAYILATDCWFLGASASPSWPDIIAQTAVPRSVEEISKSSREEEKDQKIPPFRRSTAGFFFLFVFCLCTRCSWLIWYRLTDNSSSSTAVE